MGQQRRVWRWCLGGVWAFVVVWTVCRIVPPQLVLQRWREIPHLAVLQVAGLMAAGIAVRAARFGQLLKIRTRGLWGPTAGYSFACLVLPGGLGEFVLPMYLLPLGVSMGQSLGVALCTRLMDVAVSAACLVFPLAEGLGGQVAFAAAVLAGSTLVGVVMMSRALRSRVMVLIHRVLGRWRRVENVVTQTLEVLAGLSRLDLCRLTGWTVVGKFLNALAYWRLADALGLGVGFYQIFGAMLLYSLFLLLPVQSIAGLGTSEAWWTFSLKAQGVGLSQAALAALTFHVGNLLVVAVLGAIPTLRLIVPYWQTHYRGAS